MHVQFLLACMHTVRNVRKTLNVWKYVKKVLRRSKSVPIGYERKKKLNCVCKPGCLFCHRLFWVITSLFLECKFCQNSDPRVICICKCTNAKGTIDGCINYSRPRLHTRRMYCSWFQWIEQIIWKFGFILSGKLRL